MSEFTPRTMPLSDLSYAQFAPTRWMHVIVGGINTASFSLVLASFPSGVFFLSLGFSNSNGFLRLFRTLSCPISPSLFYDVNEKDDGRISLELYVHLLSE
jgi:hypothetical protein